jgi:teichuronic acid biosynthesis glycosyltransferase TuaC
MRMNICVVSPSYPTKRTILFVFVDQLCRAFADEGIQVTVIAPQSITRNIIHGEHFSKLHTQIITNKGNTFELYRPMYFSFGNGRFNKMTISSFNGAVKRVFEGFKTKPEVCYGHFWSSIYALYPLAKKYGLPLYGASGEERVANYDFYKTSQKKELADYLNGLINVSTKNRDECVSLGLVNMTKTHTIPNAVDLELFRSRDRISTRERMGIKSTDFVVVFVGQFVYRKGTLRLSEALKLLNDENIKAIFIGSGIENPDYEHIIWKGRIEHMDIPNFLYASDVFVLPTENEGCSNAVIEAMACSLPIISTDAQFNYDILNESNSLLVDCHDISQIAMAIKKIKDNPNLRNELSKGARKVANSLSIDKRAEKILSLIRS